MHRKLAVVCLWACLVSSLWCQQAKAQPNLLDNTALPSSRILNRYGLEMAWWGQADIDGGRDKVEHIAIDERAIAVLTSSGLLTYFDSEKGTKLWVTRVGRGNQAAFLPVMNERLVMVVRGIKLYAYDRIKGRLVWQIDLPQMPSTGPSADDDQLYVGALDGSVYAFDLRKIRNLYLERMLPEYSNNAQSWRYKAGKKITSPPISTGRSVSFASTDNSLYTVSARARDLLYQFETDAPVSAPLVKHNEYLFLASQDFNFYCLNANNGQVRWSFLSGFAITKAPQVMSGLVNGQREKVVYVLPDLGGIIALRASTGKPIWSGSQTRAVEFLATAQNQMYVTDKLGNVLVLDRSNGAILGSIPAIPFNVKLENSRTDRLFLARENGLVVMIRAEDKPFPTYHQFPERQPLLPELYDPSIHQPAEAADDASEEMDLEQ